MWLPIVGSTAFQLHGIVAPKYPEMLNECLSMIKQSMFKLSRSLVSRGQTAFRLRQREKKRSGHFVKEKKVVWPRETTRSLLHTTVFT